MSDRLIVLVTGASSGIGAAIAEQLAGDGHRVYGTARNATGTTTPAGVTMLPLDVCDDASVRACVAGVLAAEPHIDVLVNNAGFLVAGAIEEVSIESAIGQLNTNFFGIARMVNAVLPSMRARKQGKIINISSLAGIVPVPFWGYYNASKFAVEGYSETLRMELDPLGIRVAMVEPGAIKTPFYAQPASTTALAVYSPWRDRALRTMAGFEKKAPGPEVVAAKVAHLIRQRRPRLRNRITREASMFSFLRWLLPAGAFERGIRSGFNLDKQSA